jgi:hypothetical protein
LDALSACYGLDELDRQALVAVAAPELDRAYERIFAYLCDEVDRRFPSVELLLYLTEGIQDRHIQRIALGPFGTLRRCRLLLPHGDAPTDLRQQVRLAPGLLEVLLGAPVDVAGIAGDPADVSVEGPAFAIRTLPHDLSRLAAAVRAGAVDAVCVWCHRPEIADAAVVDLSAAMGARLHRAHDLAGIDPQRTESVLRQSVTAAGMRRALLWLPLDSLGEESAATLDAVTAVLARTRWPLVVTAGAPWRPPGVLAARRWVELEAIDDCAAERAEYWQRRHPHIDELRIEELAARFSLAPLAAAAASGVAEAESTVLQESWVGFDALARACAAVSAPRSDRLVSVTIPRRSADDLVLSAPLHAQVLDVASFARAVPILDHKWRDNRLTGGHRGYKVLFTGDPGTGKTLAAEVIALRLGVQLVRVDLSRVVSKWVGETAKHLDEVFHLTSGSSAVLFFDEADALFGKRAEVRHGTDRYANTEVSHLLQRFEDYAGLVVLASNLHENIDPAFARRFHAVIHFPRPDEPERRRLWEKALPLEALDGDVDLDVLATVDLTGSGIVGAVRTAGLVGTAAGDSHLSMRRVVEGIARQFRSEGRLFPVDEIRPFGGGRAPDGVA